MKISRSVSLVPVLVVLTSLWACSHAEPPAKTTLTSAVPAAAFPEHDARTAIAAAAHGLSSCKMPDGPQEMNVTLQFEPTGHVSDIEIVPFDPDVAPCVKQRLARVEVRPFEGDAQKLVSRVKL